MTLSAKTDILCSSVGRRQLDVSSSSLYGNGRLVTYTYSISPSLQMSPGMDLKATRETAKRHIPPNEVSHHFIRMPVFLTNCSW